MSFRTIIFLFALYVLFTFGASSEDVDDTRDPILIGRAIMKHIRTIAENIEMSISALTCFLIGVTFTYWFYPLELPLIALTRYVRYAKMTPEALRNANQRNSLAVYRYLRWVKKYDGMEDTAAQWEKRYDEIEHLRACDEREKRIALEGKAEAMRAEIDALAEVQIADAARRKAEDARDEALQRAIDAEADCERLAKDLEERLKDVGDAVKEIERLQEQSRLDGDEMDRLRKKVRRGDAPSGGDMI
jgi:hypothetical protein